MAKVYIIGVTGSGADGLTARARRLIIRAEMLCGGQRLLDMFPAARGEKIPVSYKLPKVAELIKTNMGRKRIVVLASGDPGFYGIAGYLMGRLGRAGFEVIPNVSAMQQAFARAKESWEGAALLSVHGRPLADIVAAVRSHDKAGIFTDAKNTPAAIARALLEQGLDGYRAYVCQDIGTAQEKVVATGLRGLLDKVFSPLNVLVLVKHKQTAKPAARPGIPDGEFHRRGGLITKQEVRAVSLAKLRLADDSVIWDIGAGSGAVAIEAALLASGGQVCAVEKDDADITIIKKNVRKFGVGNVRVVQAVAPDGLAELPEPDAVFIGGSGGRMKAIIDLVCKRLRLGGRIVVNLVALENLEAAVRALKANDFKVNITQVAVSRSAGVLDLTRFEALNPVFVLDACREAAGE